LLLVNEVRHALSGALRRQRDTNSAPDFLMDAGRRYSVRWHGANALEIDLEAALQAAVSGKER
jgi:hypothetical protein